MAHICIYSNTKSSFNIPTAKRKPIKANSYVYEILRRDERKLIKQRERFAPYSAQRNWGVDVGIDSGDELKLETQTSTKIWEESLFFLIFEFFLRYLPFLTEFRPLLLPKNTSFWLVSNFPPCLLSHEIFLENLSHSFFRRFLLFLWICSRDFFFSFILSWVFPHFLLPSTDNKQWYL